jgi:hypothetical protein
MGNYYTTRFNPLDWPPDEDTIPAGVLLTAGDLEDRGFLCCQDAEVVASGYASTSERWVYHTDYQIHCPHHPDATIQVRRAMDWISPNEYLMD